MGEGIDKKKGHAAIQRDFDRLVKGAEEPYQAEQREVLTPAPGEK